MHKLGETPDGDHATSLPSGFKYLVGAAALFIAICSAFFSVRGLGLLFVGSATAVMIMAASLEVGKLVAAAFLYRYWRDLNRVMKFYLTTAVVVLIGITSLGNYGYLARAYERTHSQIGLYEDQIKALETEVADTQRQIDQYRGQVGKVTDAGREDRSNVQQRIASATAGLEASLARVQEQRKTAQDRRDQDIQVLTQRLAEQAEVLKKAMASEDAAVAELTARLAVLDRAVDAYTKLGGPGLFKADGVKKGQELREQQRPEREAIAASIAEHQTRQTQLRTEHAKSVAATDKDIAAVRDQSVQELARLDTEEQTLRTANAEALAQIELQLTALQSQGQVIQTSADAQIETLYQRIRSRNDEIRRLREQIAATDIGSYRFVARALEAPADSVVKWLMLALVLVFDPLAVSLAVGFNVALLRDPRRRRPSVLASSAPVVEQPVETKAALGGGNGRRMAVQTTLLIAVLAGIGLAAAAYLGVRMLHGHSVTAHAQMIPTDSFAVATLHPAQLRQPKNGQKVDEWLGTSVGKTLTESMVGLLGGGFDPQANIYAFAKFPTGRLDEKSDRPTMLCGLVARVTDQTAAEAALSQLADRLASSLRPAAATTPLTRSRAMIRYGRGRYMDPEGGFFSFAIADGSAILLLEVEGDPKAPRIENEMRACLASPNATAVATTQTRDQLPTRALSANGAVALWVDAGRFFSNLPKNPAAQARYQQLEQHLGFDLLLKVQPAAGNQLNLTADYAYQVDRFKQAEQSTAVQVLATLGPVEPAGIAGRLMDRCADTLDYDSLIERLRSALGGAEQTGVQQVLVEKSYASNRDARFVMMARYDPQVGPPLMAALNTLWQ